MSHQLVAPTGRAAGVIVEVPHAGTVVPLDESASLAIDPAEVASDADLYVDELFKSAPTHGAALLTTSISRYVVDLNRNEDDVDARAVTGITLAKSVPRGVIWCETTDGRPVLRRPLTRDEFETRLDRYYRPYHEALAREVTAMHARHGSVVVISAHSMPSVGRSSHGDRGRRRADVVPGTRGRTTASATIIDVIESHFRAAGLTVRHDEPYRGGATTARWGRPTDGFHAVQIELNRALYMDETSRQRRPEGYRWVAALCDELIARLASIDRQRVAL